MYIYIYHTVAEVNSDFNRLFSFSKVQTCSTAWIRLCYQKQSPFFVFRIVAMHRIYRKRSIFQESSRYIPLRAFPGIAPRVRFLPIYSPRTWIEEMVLWSMHEYDPFLSLSPSSFHPNRHSWYLCRWFDFPVISTVGRNWHCSQRFRKFPCIAQVPSILLAFSLALVADHENLTGARHIFLQEICFSSSNIPRQCSTPSLAIRLRCSCLVLESNTFLLWPLVLLRLFSWWYSYFKFVPVSSFHHSPYQSFCVNL